MILYFSKSMLNCFTSQKAKFPNSTKRWHGLLYTKQNIPKSVLYAILYAHSASSILKLQSFLLGFTVFTRVDLISLLETLALPLVYGKWCGNSMFDMIFFSRPRRSYCKIEIHQRWWWLFLIIDMGNIFISMDHPTNNRRP